MGQSSLRSWIAALFRRSVSLRFIMIGCVNTLFSFLFFAFFLRIGLDVELGSLCALSLGVVFSFYSQGTIVFKHTSFGALCRFIAAWGVIYFVNVAIVRSLMSSGHSSYLSAAIATVPVTALSYFIQKLVVFRPPASTYLTKGNER
jgi:putative flippase GtrA